MTVKELERRLSQPMDGLGVVDIVDDLIGDPRWYVEDVELSELCLRVEVNHLPTSQHFTLTAWRAAASGGGSPPRAGARYVA